MFVTSQVPLWVPLVVGLLAVAGTVSGALGAQIVAGRNELRRLKSERTEKRLEYWRDKRMTTYSRYLSLAIELIILLQERLATNEPIDPSRLNALPRAAKVELEMIRMLGTSDTVRLADQVQGLIGSCASQLSDTGAQRSQFERYLGLLDQEVFDMMTAFRTELGLSARQLSDP
jgi:hypothetical protein